MEKKFLFEDLNVYQRSLKMAIDLCKIGSEFPYKFSRIRDQLIGAVISVPLNIAEGWGRKSEKEKKNFYKISLSSLFECIPLLEICLDLNLLKKLEYEKFRKEITEIAMMIHGLIKSV
jgi:four helix bundle protein